MCSHLFVWQSWCLCLTFLRPHVSLVGIRGVARVVRVRYTADATVVYHVFLSIVRHFSSSAVTDNQTIALNIGVTINEKPK